MEVKKAKDQTICSRSVTRGYNFSYFSLVNHSFAYPALDGLRAIAIILVLLRHSVTTFEAPTNNTALAIWNIFRNGWLGVDLFFVLSGFLITRSFFSLYRRHNNYPATIKKFYIHRTLRTWPLYFAIIALISLGAFPYYQVSGSTVASELLQHVLFLQDYLGTSILVPLWSLATEEKFYLLIPLLLAICVYLKKSHAALLLTAIIIASAITRCVTSTSNAITDYESFFWIARAPFHLALDGLMAGCVIYFIHQALQAKHSSGNYRKLSIMLSLFMLGLLAYSDYLGNSEWLTTAAMINAASIIFALLVYFALFSGKNWLSCIPLRIISTLSYSLYLCHYALLPYSQHLSGVTDAASTRFLSTDWFIFFICFIGLSLAVSLLLHYSIEKPFLLWKRRLSH